MQQALGLIETKGLLAAIECADAMLKAAEVSLLEKTLVGGGLVTIAVTGDVAAVKASVEAGVASVNRIDSALLISDHVIPRPHMELDDVIVSATPLKDKAPTEEPPEAAEPETEPEPEPETVTLDNTEEPEIVEEPVEEETMATETAETEEEPEATVEPEEEPVLETVQEIEIEAPTTDIHKEDLEKMVGEYGLEAVIRMLNKCKVLKLRNLAREYDDFGIAGRMISKADKKTLIAEFERYYK